MSNYFAHGTEPPNSAVNTTRLSGLPVGPRDQSSHRVVDAHSVSNSGSAQPFIDARYGLDPAAQ